MIGSDPRSEMLFDMGQCAYRLGKTFAAEAERAETHERRMEFFHLFDRCSFAVRMSIALELRLRREARVEGRAQALGREALDSEAAQRDARDPPETECYIEGDREREREPASLPVLLSSLASVAADATALPGPQPAALPTLRELLARVKSETVPTARPPSNGALRARLAGSATTPAFALASSAPPHPSGRVTPRLRATGPPR